MLKNKVLNTIEEYGLIDTGDKIVVGVSGGPDSMCLLNILNELKEFLGIEIFVAHVNHMIREEADEETAYVQDFCDKNGIQCFVKKVDVLLKAKDDKVGTEEAGRTVRYDFFEEVLKKVNANKIATAHNSNDNAETVLMNIMRGCGTSGLKGIEPIRDGKFIRPIIECERHEIESYCTEYKLDPKIDKSNFENIYTRNKIRNILIPELKDKFNPNIIQALNNLSKMSRLENEFLQNESTRIFEEELKLTEQSKRNAVILDLKKFNKLNKAIQGRIVMQGIKSVLGSTQGIEKVHVDDILKMCEKNVGNKYLTPNKNIKVSIEKGKIIFEKM